MTKSLKGCTIYVSLFPCNECAKAIVQSGIKKVVYLSDKHAEKDSTKASKRIFKNAEVELKQLNLGDKEITLKFTAE